MNSSDFIIISMKSIHEILKMESLLEKENIPFRTVAKPRALSADCGMAIRVEERFLPHVYHVAEQGNCTVKGVYRRVHNCWMSLNKTATSSNASQASPSGGLK